MWFSYLCAGVSHANCNKKNSVESLRERANEHTQMKAEDCKLLTISSHLNHVFERDIAVVHLSSAEPECKTVEQKRNKLQQYKHEPRFG